MGGAASLNPFTVTFSPFIPIIVTVTTLILIASAEDHDSKENGGIPGLEDDNGATTSSPPPTPSTGSSGHQVRKSVAFKPSTAVIVGVLTTTFSLTFLLLLYIKHCNSGNTFVANNNANLDGEARLHERKNSGIEREVVESLPVFRFGSLRGQKHGLECAVCLNGFEDPEVLRLLPKCKHAFHMECVDTWLDEHSTCPLCRDKVDTDDVVQVERQNAEEEASSSDIESGRVNNISNDNALQPGNVGSSRRVSSVGERESGLLEIVLQAQGEDSSTSSFRRSLDSVNRKSAEHRLEHRIIVSPSRGVHQRWSDFETSDLLYLTSDMIISDGSSSQRNNNNAGRGGRRTVVERNRNVVDDEMENGFGVGGGGRGVGNMRSASAVTGMRRILSRGRGTEREHGGGGREEQERRREGVVSRWLAWTSRSQSHGDVC